MKYQKTKSILIRMGGIHTLLIGIFFLLTLNSLEINFSYVYILGFLYILSGFFILVFERNMYEKTNKSKLLLIFFISLFVIGLSILTPIISGINVSEPIDQSSLTMFLNNFFIFFLFSGGQFFVIPGIILHLLYQE